jgi:crotonobetainyl-CoA:carnitine CoA-transferase CaiB-like acyl-CoA transferase
VLQPRVRRLRSAATEGTRVDLSIGIPGGFCTKLLADFGADVISIESPSAAGVVRRTSPFANDAFPLETGALHLYLNTSKRSMTLNLDASTGRDLLRRLLTHVDALVDDRPVGSLENDGLRPERLAEEFPKLVVTLLSPYGQSGPYAQVPATNLTSFASGGQMAATGEPDCEP